MNKKYRKKKPNNNKEEINTLNEEDFSLNTTGQMEHTMNETLMLFSYSWRNRKRYRLFYGVGTVYRVVKGEKQDLIYINFGVFPENQTKLVVAYDNIARRQVLTLKKGQPCQVYGLCRYYTTEFETEDGRKLKRVRLGLYAKGINGWYVPTMMDIKKMPTNEDVVDPSEKEEELLENFDDILDSFLNGKGED